ncbi:hypothetical protein BGZ47_007015 [Haplosporangium gracile]|nr:hypothetical protein BGZ47_007015 [Haplosporangium gracile]
MVLVIQNPDLDGLRLGKNLSELRLGLHDEFTFRTLASLRSLAKLDTYAHSEGFDFRMCSIVQADSANFRCLSLTGRFPKFERCNAPRYTSSRDFYCFSTASQISTSYG